MRVVVIKAGEPVPAPGHPVRWARSGLLARALAARGHRVDWVVSAFDHGAKAQVYPADTKLEIEPGIDLTALHAPAYAGHRSVARLWHHRVLTAKLERWFATATPPDLIVAALPVPEMAAAATRFARSRGIPVVVDCRDMWPDIFREDRAGVMRTLVNVATTPMARATAAACRGATAITGHTERFVEWGVAKAERGRRPDDRSFPLGYSAEAPAPAAVQGAERELDALGLPSARQALRAVFVGTLSQHFDLTQVIAVARRAVAAGVPLEVVICGEGDRRDGWERAAAGVPGVHWLGWRQAPFIHALLRRSDLGLAPYVPSPSFVQSIPNKICEYLSAGLPIISTLPGESEPLLTRDGAGWRVGAGDVEGMFQLVERLAADRTLVQERGGAAAKLFDAQFRAEQVYGDFAAHLEGMEATGSAR